MLTPRHLALLLAVLSFAIPAHPASRRRAHPEPALPALLHAFQTYDVVALPAAHGEKDIDDLLLALLRDPRLPSTVNDIVVECGNMRLQPLLDRYIAGDAVPFTEVQHVWRDTTVQQMCGASAFYEQLFPLVRSLNQHLPAARRLRVVAADPPIDWSTIHSYNDLRPFFDRDGNIAAVMEREVLARHRKALMLFGTSHLLHGGGPGAGDAVTRFERHFPGRTFVVSELWGYNLGHEPFTSVTAPGGLWPALLPTRNTPLGDLPLDRFMTSPLTTDPDCTVRDAFPPDPARTVSSYIDAFLYLGPQQSLLAEPLPASIALDHAYRAEWLRRMHLVGLPSPPSLDEVDTGILAGAADPVLAPPSPPQPIPQSLKDRLHQDCLTHLQSSPAPARN